MLSEKEKIENLEKKVSILNSKNDQNEKIIAFLSKEVNFLTSKNEQIEKQIALLVSNRIRPNGKCITHEEVAEWLGTSVDTVRRHVKAGKLICLFPKAKQCFKKSHVLEFMADLPGKRRKALG